MLAKPDLSLHSLRIITKKELRLLVPYVPQHILRLENEGKFPKRIKLGANRVGWRLVEVEEWLRKRIAARDGNGVAPPPAEKLAEKQP
jgi:prophage regulatory protein